jgi:hypothetical protein
MARHQRATNPEYDTPQPTTASADHNPIWSRHVATPMDKIASHLGWRSSERATTERLSEHVLNSGSANLIAATP